MTTEPSPGTWTRTRRAVVVAIAAVAAVGAVLAEGAPTGTDGVDPALRAGLALVTVAAATRARPWTAVVLAGGATALAAGPVTAAIGLLALVVAAIGAWDEQRAWVLSPLGVALGLQSLLRLDLIEPHAASAVLVALLVAPLLLSATRRGTRRQRRITAVAVAFGALVVALATAGLAVAAFQARDDVGDATTATRNAFKAAEAGDEEVAVRLFEQAAAGFEEAEDHLGLPLLDLTRFVPVIAQHARAVEVLTATGVELTRTAARSTSDAPLDELGAVDGRIDLDQLEEFVEPVDRAAASLRMAERATAEVESDWFVAKLGDKVDEFAAEVADVLPDAELAAQGLEVAPELLGGDGIRRYFVIFMNPAESRGLGGFMGSFGVLEALDGSLELTTSEGIEWLEARTRAAGAEVSAPPDYVDRYGRYEPAHFPGDLTLSPDLPSVAIAVDDVLRQSVGRGVDGVIAVDPVALGAFLELTGPITVDGAPVTLTADNAADFLLRDQYLLFTPEDPNRKDFLADASRETFEQLTDGDLPDPAELSRVLDPVVDQGRLGVHAFDEDEQRFFEVVGVDARFPRARGGDLIGLTTQNSANNKIDAFLSRSLRYDADFDPATGAVEATATVTLTNEAPDEGLPNYVIGSTDRPGRPPFPDGTNWANLSLYSPLQLDGASVDGRPLPVESGEELGSRVYSGQVVIPSGATVEVTYSLSGVVDPEGGYRLAIPGQPTVNDDRVEVTVRGAPGWRMQAGHGFEQRGDAVGATLRGPADTRLAAGAERTD